MTQVQWADGRQPGYPGLSGQDCTQAVELDRCRASGPPSYAQVVQNRPAPESVTS